MAKKYRVYEVQVHRQLTRLVACEDIKVTDSELRFVADGVTVFSVSQEECRWWQLTPRTARRPGVRRSRTLSQAYGVFSLAKGIGKGR